jgi:hypothetical protein
MKKKIFVGLLSFILCTSVVYAAANFNIGSHVKVVDNTSPGSNIELAFFEDEECSVPLSFVEWGTMTRNTSQTIDPMFYVKNTGTVNAVIDCTTSDLVSSQFVLEFTIDDTTLSPGESTKVSGKLIVKPSAPLGDKDFTIVVSGE